MTDVERLKHQRKVIDDQIRAAERCQVNTRLRDIVRRLASQQDLPVADIVETALGAWKSQPDGRHTVAEFLEILGATVSGYGGALSDD